MSLSSSWKWFVGVLALLLPVLVLGCGAADGSEDVDSIGLAACTGSKLSATPGAPVNPGTAVTLTATPATCAGGETPEYRFAYKRIGSGGYVEIQGWSSSATANWDTTGLAAGQYDLIVYTRAAGGGSFQGAAHLGYFINDICTSVTLSTNPAPPQSPGTQVALTANGVCNGAATPEFRFAYRLSSSPTWTQIQTWGTGSANWNTTGLSSGTYYLIAYVRAVGNTSSWEAVKYATYQLGGACSSVTLSASPPSPQFPGTMVSLSASSSCASGLTPEYRFFYQQPNDLTWYLIQDWNGSTANWDTTGLTTGQYTLRADVRAVENGGASEAVDYENYTLWGSQYSEISTGVGWHSCATVNDGTARCWGLNDAGQIGDGTTSNSSSPAAVSGLSTVASIAPGGYHTCAALTDGTARCWGNNSDGTLGDGTQTDSSTPVTVSGLTGVTAVSSGTYHSCALKSDGTVWCWGDNEFGQIGNGTYTGNVLTPMQVTGVSGAIAVSAGGWHTCALTGGTVLCWGLNDFGQLGSGSTNTLEPSPVTVSGLSAATAVSAGDSHSCALKSGQPRCWGYNAYGQLGNGTTTDSNVPVLVALTQMTHVSAGYAHTCARRSPDGSLRCWGNNDFGELGDGTFNTSSTPVTVSGISGATSAGASGGLSSCALLSNGTGRCWGDNFYGQLGDGTTSGSTTPVMLLGP